MKKPPTPCRMTEFLSASSRPSQGSRTPAMRMGRRAGSTARPRLAVLTVVVSLLTCLLLYPFTSAAGPSDFKTVVVLYSETDNGSPGNVLLNRSIRATFEAGSPGRVVVHNEHLDISRSREADYAQFQTEFLRRKYAGRKVDLLIAFLPASLDFALKNREGL